jgi:pimeloyl-ACP methyl ester carboxylesterase
MLKEFSSNKFVYKKSLIYYDVFGQIEEASKVWITLHGFADSSKGYKALGEAFVQKQQALVVFDLPFHGETNWVEEDYTPQNLAEIIELLAITLKLTQLRVIAHSMGGRLFGPTLNLLDKYKVEELILIAPAGIHYQNMMLFKLAVPKLVKWLSNKYINKEGVPFIYRTLHKLKLTNSASFRFMEQQFENKRRRIRLFHTWSSLFYFPINPHKYIEALNKKVEGNINLILGSKDKIISMAHRRPFEGNVNKLNVHIIPSGHFMLTDKALIDKIHNLI